MKAKYLTVWFSGWFFLLANPAWAEMADETAKSYIGVRLNQVPEILRKHLKLDDNRGLLVQNIQLGSPADKAGLEKDDIIISWNGQPVTSYQEFVDQVQQAGQLLGGRLVLDEVELLAVLAPGGDDGALLLGVEDERGGVAQREQRG